MYSVDTVEDAKMLLCMACSTNLKGQYIARELVEEQTIPNLFAFGERLDKTWNILQKKKKISNKTKLGID